MKLRQRGVDEATIGQAVSTIDRASEYATAQRLVARKLPSLHALDPAVQARRLVAPAVPAWLLGPGLAHQVVRAAIAESISARPNRRWGHSVENE